jgi:hypothetical protein
MGSPPQNDRIPASAVARASHRKRFMYAYDAAKLLRVFERLQFGLGTPAVEQLCHAT